MMDRRRFIGAAAGGLSSIAMTGRLGRGNGADRPNVLFIAIDDLNDWIGCLGGHPDARTPNIDRLASKGVTFTRAYCAAPACNPSRAALLTGRRPVSSGVYTNNQPWRPAMPDAVTLPMHFKQHGYKVVGRGKIFHGRYSKDVEAWDEYISQGSNPMPKNRPVNGIPNTAHFDWGPVDAKDEDMDDTKIALWAGDFLQHGHDRPFFLACGFYRPHLPWYAPQKYFDRFPPESVTLPNVDENDLDDIPPAGRRMARPEGDHERVTETDNWRKAVSAYLACCSFTDANVGRLLDALARSPHADNTIVVLWGDHGWHLGEKLHWRKFALWEEATRSPLIFSVPGGPEGAVCGRTVGLMDIYPTLSDLCGLEPRGDWEANSLTPLLDDPKAEWRIPALTTHGRGNHGVRSERWRYIRYADGSEELYDHEHDPMEWTNLARVESLADVKNELASWLPETEAENAPERG